MEVAQKYPEHEYHSSSELDSEGEDNEEGEKMTNRFTKWRKIKVAVASDIPVWLGIQPERETNQGGAKYKFGFAGQFGAGFKRPKKETHLISRIPWQKANGHE